MTHKSSNSIVRTTEITGLLPLTIYYVIIGYKPNSGPLLNSSISAFSTAGTKYFKIYIIKNALFWYSNILIIIGQVANLAGGFTENPGEYDDGIGSNAKIGLARGMDLDTNTMELYFAGKWKWKWREWKNEWMK